MQDDTITIPSRCRDASKRGTTASKYSATVRGTVQSRGSSGASGPPGILNTLHRNGRPLLNILQKKPVLAVFEVNLRCNSSCAYCDLPLNRGRYEMTRQEIRRVFQSLHAEGLRFVFLQGGEPTLRSDLFAIMQDLHDIGFVQTLVTNGTRITHSFVQSLKTLPVNVAISLDTLDRKRYQVIRGADQLNAVLAAVNRMHDYPHPRFINCVVSEENRDEVMEIVRFALDHGFAPVLTPYHWEVGRYGRAEPMLQYDREAMATLFGEILKGGAMPSGYINGYIRDNIRWLQGKSLGRCDAGRYSISIDASGNVAPCSALEHAGNLLESSLGDILASMDRAKIRQCSDKAGCNLVCNRVIGSNLRHPVRALRSRDFVKTFTR